MRLYFHKLKEVTNFNEGLTKPQAFSFMKLNLKMPFATWQPFSPGLRILIRHTQEGDWIGEIMIIGGGYETYFSL